MKLRINIDGKQYEADIEVLEDERAATKRAGPTRSTRQRASIKGPRSLPEMAANAQQGDEKLCTSPILGIVVKILVSAGQSVTKGDPLLVLEAMKMESNVKAPSSGVVKSILVAAGDNVKKGQALVEFA